MARHRVALAALLAQPHPQSAVLRKDILDGHPERRADTGEGIDHQPDQGARSRETGMGYDINAVQQRALRRDRTLTFARTSRRAEARAKTPLG